MNQPTQPWPTQPPPRKPLPKWLTGWRLALAGSLAAVLMCCGGLFTIGTIFGGEGKNAAKPGRTGVPMFEPATPDPTTLLGAPEVPTPPPASSSPAVQALADPLPSTSPTPAAKPKPKPQPKPKPKPSPKRTVTKKPKPKPKSVYYKNCSAVRAAGADPIYEGDPGFGRHLDRDGDGVACE